MSTAATARDPLAHIDAILSMHPCADEKERRDVAFIREFCACHADALSRSCTAGHITGSALVMHTPTARVLLTHHRKLDRWLQFGGHGEGETDPAAIALREAIEESGLPDVRLASLLPFDVDVHRFPARGAEPEHFHLDLRYLAITEHPDDIAASSESHEIRWFSFEECAALALSEEMRRMLRKARQQQWAADQSKEPE